MIAAPAQTVLPTRADRVSVTKDFIVLFPPMNTNARDAGVNACIQDTVRATVWGGCENIDIKPELKQVCSCLPRDVASGYHGMHRT